ncbi:MAG: hypothetical protein OSJ70_03585 [Bacilli bacterium]|nr:hypothetical protein [Bacilli bacterium]
MENYGKILRKFINYQNYTNAVVNNCVAEWQSRRDYQEALNFKTVNALSIFACNNDYNEEGLDDRSVDRRGFKLTAMCCTLEMYVDMYRVLNLREKLDIINDLDAHILEELRKCKSIEDIRKIFSHESLSSLMVEALNFSDLSVYDKVLQTKALDEEDIAKLKEMFPLFEGEYDSYNVEVNEAFMIREMQKWKDIWPNDPEKSYEDAANFLDQYSILNNSLYISLSEKTGYAKLGDTKGMLKKLINKQ